MRTDGAIITNAGLELISYAIANSKNITFTKTKLGKGDVNTFDEAKKLTDVVSFYKQIPITSISRNNAGVVRIRSTFTNEDFPIEVVLKEVGIFATVEGKNEALFAYVNDGVGESFPPGSSGNVVERIRDIYVGVSTALDVNVIIDKSVVYATMFDLEEGLNKKEDKFTKNSGFNKNKSDSTSSDDSNVLATSKAVKLTMEKATEASNDAAGKEPKFDKNTAFNKNFGTGQNEVLEGSKLAEILGIEYGGILNNANAKVAGKGYYDTANKKIYKCTADTSINYADAAYFIEVSNNDLLGKLQNLTKTFYLNNDTLVLRINIIKNLCFFNFAISAEAGLNANFRFESNQILFDLSSFGIAFSDSFEVAIGRIYNPTVGAEIPFRVRFDKETNRIISKVAGFNGYSESFGNYAILLKV
ncbi:MAG: hypothetical protein RSC71_06900 [Cetobacterium sp.]